ncbi:kinase-like protein, partial [Zopfia rhizophila CBS 207.26]
AIKIFDRKGPEKIEGTYAREIESEFRYMEMFREDPNIVQGISLLKEGDRFLMVMEYCPGSLIAKLERGRLEEREAERIFGSVLKAVRFIHSKGVAHRDLKAENVMICGDGMPKVGDFGSAVPFLDESGQILFSKDVEGTEPYLPPEINRLPAMPYNAALTDIWQLGILYVAMALRKLPWDI